MSKVFRKMGGFLLALVLLLSMSVTAFAYTDIDTDKTGSLTVSPTNGGSIGTELTLYQVADVVVDDADQKYVPTGDFENSGADLTNLDDAETLAKTLSAYVTEKNLSGTTKAVGTDGSVQFDNLKLGLYLVIQKVARQGESIVNPFVVSVPTLNSNEEWVYDVDASPKAETFEFVDVTVKKVWNDGNDTSKRSDSVTVHLYRDSDLIDTVTLNSDNSWTYTWTDLQKSDGYSVKEDAISNYTAAYSRSGYTFTVTNTRNTETLVQTGQLNWPIPVLAGCGLALFALGWWLVFLKRKKDA